MTRESTDDLRNHLDEYPAVRVGVKNAGTWVDRRHLSGEDRPDEYLLRVRDIEDRYRMVTADEEMAVFGRKQVTFSISDFDGRQVIVELSREESNPPECSLSEGDEFRVPADVLALESGSEREYKSVRVNRVAGLAEEKERLENFLQSDDVDWGLAEPTGLLLEGPPGTGKTELVMEVCEELYGSIPVTISGPEILSKWVGESERLLREKFKEARQRNHSVLYIDELDAIAQSRSDTSESYSAQIVAQLLVLLDGVSSKQDAETDDAALKVVASTNLAEAVDPALRRPGRLGGRPVRFRRPNPDERTAIFHQYLEQVWTSDDGRLTDSLVKFVTNGTTSPERCTDEEITEIEDVIAAAERCTGAEIEDVVQETVQRVRDDDEDRVSAALLNKSEQLAESTGVTEEELTIDDLEIDSTDGKLAPGSYHVTEDTESPKEVAKRYFWAQREDSEGSQTYLYRKLKPRDVLSGDATQIREKVAHAFQHRSDEEVVIYLRHGELLAQTQSRSPQVTALIDALNEQLLQWHDQVLLLVPGATNDAIIPNTNT